jgi:hypothetical protein
MNSDVQKRIYVIPIGCDRNAYVTITDALEIDDGLGTFMWTYESGVGILVSSPTSAEDCTSEIIQSITTLTALPYEAAEPLVRFWLSLLLNVEPARAIETMLETCIPMLGEIYREHAGVERLTQLSPRLYDALKSGSSPREIATKYFDDQSSRSDGLAFLRGLRINDEIDESRVCLMKLLPPGDHRVGLQNELSPKVWIKPGLEISRITEHLSVPVARDFAAVALSEARSRLVLCAALRLGIRAEGNDGRTAYEELRAAVARSSISAPRSLTEKLMAAGPVGKWGNIHPVTTEPQLKKLATTARNCLSNRAHPWFGLVMRGECELFVLRNDDVIHAVVAIDPKINSVLEMRGVANAEVATDIADSIRKRVREAGALR